MSALRDAVEEYVALRRSLGSRLHQPAKALRRFVEFLENEGVDCVTTELALRWAQEPAGAQPSTWADRLGVVRRFAAWRSATDPSTEIPAAALLPHRRRRKPPYVYADNEIERIVTEAARLPSVAGLRGPTFATLFGLLAATGLRIGEALALDLADVDLHSGILAIRKAKFGKSRFVPLHESARRALAGYAAHRDRILPRRADQAFFVSEHGARVGHELARWTFAKVSRTTGLRAPTVRGRKGRGPRLHDIRHRFAVATLIRWYREGRDVERELPKLSTYLGHVHVHHTYWYIEAVPELLRLATERLTEGRREVAP